MAVANWAEAHSILSIKLNLMGRRGWPDRLFFLPGGRPLLIEMKALGETPRRLQEHIHGRLRDNGYEVQTHDTAAGAIAVIAARLGAGVVSNRRR